MTGICTACHEPCEVRVVDFGIGPYEYWGAVGFDSKPEAVSNCCEAPVRDETGVLIHLHDLQDENDYPERDEED